MNPQTTCKIPRDIVPSEIDLKAALERSMSPLLDLVSTVLRGKDEGNSPAGTSDILPRQYTQGKGG